MSSHAVLSAGFTEAAAALVRRRTGLVFGESRRSSFAAALAKAMRCARVSDPELYLARLDVEPALLDDLVAEITIGETYFFREPQQFAVIRDEILPALLSQRPAGWPLRVWSAGCASGEEPYTLAILFQEAGQDGRYRIVGTDLSRVALARASQARYARWSLRGVPEEAIEKYFVGHAGQFELGRPFRSRVEFRYLNLAADTYPSLATGIWGMDLILCRNVLIYFDAETVARVARRLIDSLADDGWLLLGASDPLIADVAPCEVVVTGAGLAYRRPGRHEDRPREPGQPATLRASRPAPPPPPPPPPPPAPAATEAPVADDAEEAARSYAAMDYERAADLALRATRGDGNTPASWVVLVRALANRGELDEAGRASAAALDRHRTSAELTYLHAVLLAEAGRHTEAVTALRRALYLDRRLVVAHLALGGALARVGDAAAAGLAFRNAERLLAELPANAIVPASDGEPAGRLAEMARAQLELVTAS